MDYMNTPADNFVQEGSVRGIRSSGKQMNDGTVQFKSKNLEAERKRRRKLNEMLMNLRAAVPVITSMTKDKIIEDAITYITGLKKHVDGLTNQVIEMDNKEGQKQEHVEDALPETEKIQVEADVQITYLDENRLWFKIECESKRGEFTKVVEIINNLGFDISDINFTTSNGATLIVFCVKVKNREKVSVDQLREYLLQMMW